MKTVIEKAPTKFYRVLMPLFLLFISACQESKDKVALGTLEMDRIAHTATVNEVIVSLPIAQGSTVQKGDILVQLDDRQQQAKLAQSRANFQLALANLDKLKTGAREEDIAMARADVVADKALLKQRQTEFKRIENLYKKQTASQSDYDKAEAIRTFQRAKLASSEQRLQELVKGSREEDIRIAQAQVEASQALVSLEERRLAELTVTATRDGRLDTLPWNLGERVAQGSPLAIVLAGEAPFARVYIPEPYRVNIKVGQSLPVKVDGVDNTITGEVRWISSEPAFTPYYALNQHERARLMYLVEVQLPKTSAQLPIGLPAQVHLP